jgi:hypothetical protein
VDPGVIFDKKITWRLHIETVAAKAYRTCIRLHFLFKSDQLSANIRLSHHEALIRSVMTYACPAWEFAAHTHQMIFQRLQNSVLRTTRKLPRTTSIRDKHMAFEIPYVYACITKLCRQQDQFIKNHENIHARNIGQREARQRKHKSLELGGGQVYDC